MSKHLSFRAERVFLFYLGQPVKVPKIQRPVKGSEQNIIRSVLWCPGWDSTGNLSPDSFDEQDVDILGGRPSFEFAHHNTQPLKTGGVSWEWGLALMLHSILEYLQEERHNQQSLNWKTNHCNKPINSLPSNPSLLCSQHRRIQLLARPRLPRLLSWRRLRPQRGPH